MQIKRRVLGIVLVSFMAVIFGGCAQKTMDKRSFVLNESVSLAQDMHYKASLLFQHDPLSVPAYWDSFEDAGMSLPDSAVIITIDSNVVVSFEYFDYIDLSDQSEELIELLAPAVTSNLISLVFPSIMDMDKGYDIQTMMNPFYAMHIKEAPEDFDNTLVFMDFNKCTVISSFIQQDDYISCLCSYIIPDMTAEELLDGYSDNLVKNFENNFLAGHTEIIDSEKLDEIING